VGSREQGAVSGEQGAVSGEQVQGAGSRAGAGNSPEGDGGQGKMSPGHYGQDLVIMCGHVHNIVSGHYKLCYCDIWPLWACNDSL
jgi:hypothetical protein